MHFWNCTKDQKLHQNCAADGVFTSREFRLETRIIRVFLVFPPGYARLNRASVVVSVMVQAGGKILRQVPWSVKILEFEVVLNQKCFGVGGFSWSKLICTNTFWPYELDSSWIQGCGFFPDHPSFEGWASDSCVFSEWPSPWSVFSWSLLWCICVDVTGIMGNVSEEFERVLKQQAPYLQHSWISLSWLAASDTKWTIFWRCM